MAIIQPTLNLVAHAKATGLGKGFLKNSTPSSIATNALGKGIITSGAMVRRDFHPTTRELLGYLLEKAKTNFIVATSTRHIRNKDSASFNTDWSGSGITTSNIAALLNDGFATINSELYCSAITPPSAGNRVIYTAPSGLSVGTKYTFSAYVKSVTADGVSVKIFAGSTVNTFTASMSGWARIYAGFTASSTSVSMGLEFPSAGATIKVDCMQLEVGDISSPLYTRARDELTFPDTDGTTFDSEQGTVFIKYRTSDNASKISGEKIALFMLGSTTDWALGCYATTTAGGSATPDTVTALQTLNSSLNSATSVTKSYAVSTSPRVHKVAVSYRKDTPIKLCVDGQAVGVSSASLAGWGAFNSTGTLYIGHGFGTLALDSHLQHIAYFPVYMEDADLKDLTS